VAPELEKGASGDERTPSSSTAPPSAQLRGEPLRDGFRKIASNFNVRVERIFASGASSGWSTRPRASATSTTSSAYPRCDEPPVGREVTIVGDHGLFAGAAR
jgi:hypothetical protein